MADTSMTERVKLALRLKTDAFNSEIEDLILACRIDLVQAGIFNVSEDDALVRQAIVTYCKLNFGTPYEDSKMRKSYYASLKSTYDELKAQMGMSTGYTEWR